MKQEIQRKSVGGRKVGGRGRKVRGKVGEKGGRDKRQALLLLFSLDGLRWSKLYFRFQWSVMPHLYWKGD